MVDKSLNYGRNVIRKFLMIERSSKNPAAPMILDVGAGKGADLCIAREVFPDAKLVGIESYPPNVEVLSQQSIATRLIDVEKDAFPFENESVDIIICNQVLEHVKEVFWILNEVSRTLKVGGSFILGVPNLASLHNRLLLALARQPTPIKTASAHVRGFTRHDILHFMQSGFPGGYECIGFGGGNFYPFPPSVAKPLAWAWPNAAWGIFMHFRKKEPYAGSFLDFPVREQLETNFYLGNGKYN